MEPTRRKFIFSSGSAGAALVVGGVGFAGLETPEKGGTGEAEVSPSEDLMREHGVLKRVLLIYREVMRRMDDGEAFSPDDLKDSASIIRTFIENYHEKLEENHLFPRFEKAKRFVALTEILRRQHEAGRRLTDVTLRLATPAALKSRSDRPRLLDSMAQFIRMYEPHEAREDTVLFPALHEIVSGHEFDALGEDFERKERELFGANGFETEVGKVAAIEKRLGIYDLAKFTPAV